MSLSLSLVRSLRELLAPIELALKSPRDLALLAEKLGWRVDGVLEGTSILDDVAGLSALVSSLTALLARLETGDGEPGTLVAEALDLADEVFAALTALADPPDVSRLVAPFDDPAFWQETALRLPEVLLHDWLLKSHPVVYRLLDLGGAVVVTAGDEQRLARRTVDLKAAWQLVADPLGHLAMTYGWGGDFEHEALLGRLHRLAQELEVDGRLASVRTHLDEALFHGTAGASVMELLAAIHVGYTRDGAATFALSGLVVPAPLSGRGEPDGLFLSTELIGSAAGTHEIRDGWTLDVNAAADASGAVGVLLHPSGARLRGDAPSIDAALTLTGQPETPWILFGDPEGLRLQLSALKLGLSTKGSAAAPEVLVDVAIGDSPSNGLELVIDPTEGDAFLADVLGGAPLVIPAGLSGRWSSKDGLTVDGSAGLEITKRLGTAIGPLRIDEIRLRLGIGTAGFEAIAAVSAGVEIGPIAAVVDDVGVRLAVAEAATRNRGNLGPLDVELGLKPPTGLGLSLDAGGIVSGGGYLEHDADAGRYAGTAEVGILGTGLTATGVLLTQMPAGGWSLFLSLGLELPFVPLPFGFTLNGVGGLVGINRALDAEALGDAVRSGALDAVLFPDDPIRDGPLIVSQIDEVFPPALGQHVFGPMVKIGWGGTLVELDLAVVIQVPVLKIALLGELTSIKPSREAPLLTLRLAVAGVADFVAGTLSADASLTGSRLLQYTLTGDAAYRQATKSDPYFLLSVGGFNKRFVPSTPVPSLQRVGIALDTGEDLQIQLGAYFAIASNTVQFGAAITVWAKALGFVLEGGTSFDALITLAPFGFVVDVEAWVTISAGQHELMGVRLEGTFKGPNPFRVKASATFKFLGAEKEFPIDAKIGGHKDEEPVETADVMEELRMSLTGDGAWAEVPSTAAPVGLLDAPSGTELSLLPSSSVDVRQRVVPLGLRLDHFGAMRVGTPDRFDMRPIVDGSPQPQAPVTDAFAAAQFFERTEAEKLTSPSFETFDSGVRFGGDATLHGDAKDLEPGYEEIVLEAADPTKDVTRSRGKPASGLARPRGGHAAKSAARFELIEERYVVVAKGEANPDRAALTPTTWAEAKKALAQKANAPAHHIVPWSSLPS